MTEDSEHQLWFDYLKFGTELRKRKLDLIEKEEKLVEKVVLKISNYSIKLNKQVCDYVTPLFVTDADIDLGDFLHFFMIICMGRFTNDVSQEGGVSQS